LIHLLIANGTLARPADIARIIAGQVRFASRASARVHGSTHNDNQFTAP